MARSYQHQKEASNKKYNKFVPRVHRRWLSKFDVENDNFAIQGKQPHRKITGPPPRAQCFVCRARRVVLDVSHCGQRHFACLDCMRAHYSGVAFPFTCVGCPARVSLTELIRAGVFNSHTEARKHPSVCNHIGCSRFIRKQYMRLDCACQNVTFFARRGVLCTSVIACGHCSIPALYSDRTQLCTRPVQVACWYPYTCLMCRQIRDHNYQTYNVRPCTSADYRLYQQALYENVLCQYRLPRILPLRVFQLKCFIIDRALPSTILCHWKVTRSVANIKDITMYI